MSEGFPGPAESHVLPRGKLETLDEAIVARMATYGLDVTKVRPRLLEEAINPVSAVYHLLKEKVERETDNARKQLIQTQKKRDEKDSKAEAPVQPREEAKEVQPEAAKPRKRARSMAGSEAAKMMAAAAAAAANVQATTSSKAPAPAPEPEQTEILDEEKPRVQQRRGRSMDPAADSAMAKLAAQVAAQHRLKQEKAEAGGTAGASGSEEALPKAAEGETVRVITGVGRFNASTSTAKKPAEIVVELKRVLEAASVRYTVQAGNGYVFECHDKADTPDLNVDFEVEVCRIEKVDLYGLHFRRIRGATSAYTQTCQRLMQMLRL